MEQINVRHAPQVHTDMASDARGLEHQNKRPDASVESVRTCFLNCCAQVG